MAGRQATSWWLYGLIVVGGGAIASRSRWAGCWPKAHEIQLGVGDQTHAACSRVQVEFLSDANAPSIEVSCASETRGLTLSPTEHACGATFTLLRHWRGGARNVPFIAVQVTRD